MQGEWKLKSGISSDSCHLGRKIYFGPNGRASRAPTTQSSSRMKRHRGSNLRSSEPDRIVGTTWRVPLTHTDTHMQTIRKPFPVLFLILLFFLFLIIPCYNWVLKKVSKLSVWATGFFKVSNLSETENIIKNKLLEKWISWLCQVVLKVSNILSLYIFLRIGSSAFCRSHFERHYFGIRSIQFSTKD